MNQYGVMSTTADQGMVPPAARLKQPHKDVAKVSTEFEAILLSQVLGKLRETFAMRNGSEGDPGANTLSAVAEQALCGGLAARGGIGLAAMIRRSIQQK